MMCGDDMVLMAAVPAETGGVQGFETQTHQCPACLGTERRFSFVGRKTEFVKGGTATVECAYSVKKVAQHANGADKSSVHPRSSIKLVADRAKEKPGTRQDRQNADNSVTETTLLPSEPPLIENVIPLDAGNAPGQSWVRAVEKFRRYEADLRERVEKTKTTNPNLGAKASERITVATNDQVRRVTKPHDAPVGERLRRRLPHAGSGVDHEALRRFDELWDKLVPRPSAPKPAELSGGAGATSITPFTRSASLVVEPTPTPGQKMRGKRGFKKMLEKLLQRLEPSPFRDK
jgi:hypothetical protein